MAKLTLSALLLLLLVACGSKEERLAWENWDSSKHGTDYTVRKDAPLTFSFRLPAGHFRRLRIQALDQSIFMGDDKEQREIQRGLTEFFHFTPNENGQVQITIATTRNAASFKMAIHEEGPVDERAQVMMADEYTYWHAAAMANDERELYRTKLEALLKQDARYTIPEHSQRMLRRMYYSHYYSRNFKETFQWAARAVDLARERADYRAQSRALYFQILTTSDLEASLDRAFRILDLPIEEAWMRRDMMRDKTGSLQAAGARYYGVGQYQTAMELYGHALRLAEESGDLRQQALCRQSIALAYSALGNSERAEAELDQCALLWAEMRKGQYSRPIYSAYLMARARVAQVSGDYERGLDAAHDALQELVANEQPGARFSVLNQMGRMDLLMGHLDQAEAWNLENLQTQDGPRAAGLRLNLAEIAFLRAAEDPNNQRNHKQQGLSWLAATFADVTGDPISTARALRLQAAAGEDFGVDVEAALCQAVELVEGERNRFKEAALRGDFYGSQQDYFSDYIAFLEARNQDDDAEQALLVAERARARNLLDVFSAGPDLRRVQFNWDLLKNYWQLKHRLEDETDLSASLRATLEQERNQLDAELQQRERPPLQPDIIISTDEIRQVAQYALVLQFHLQESRGRVWLIEGDSVRLKSLPGRAVLDPLVDRVRVLLQQPPQGAEVAERDGLLKELADHLLKPLGEQLRGRRLVIIADGSLQLLPFAVLPDPGNQGRLLLERFEISYLPSLSVLTAMRRLTDRRPKPSGALAVFANPRYRAERTRGAATRDEIYQPLPGSRREARKILAYFDQDRCLSAMGVDAEKSRTADLGNYRYLHFATHGVVDGRDPNRSSLVLSLFDRDNNPIDGHLTLDEISRLELNADLVVLSACRTALGREVRGEGLISLARGFMHAGTPRVVASLWQVSDNAGQDLMDAFYREVVREGKGSAAGLRQARLQLAQQERFSDPYYWAPFVHIGDWR